jgi:hypothetical protein
MEVMFIENASIQSAGESPIFTSTVVLGEVVRVDPAPELLPPPLHAVNRDANKRARQAITAVPVDLNLGVFRMETGWRRFIVVLLQ